jgi:formyltetrahydrofolate deformylase
LIAEKFGMQWNLYFSDETPRMAVFVSRLPHCLFDILSRCQSGDWKVEVPLIVSNHPDLESVAKRFGIAYHVFSAAGADKQDREQKQLALLQEQRVDFIVLARYMQILTNEFVSHYPNRIINIHHSFLPAFPGARPYHAAYEHGVKIIGATSHYVTAELDAGPIIEQDVVRVSYKDGLEDLIRKGQDLEKVVLSRAIWYHLNRKILVYGNRTICFI